MVSLSESIIPPSDDGFHSITVWRSAESPNYCTNADLAYHYSEVPYIGQYKLVKLPLSLNNLVYHIDYWGEGRIVSEGITTGFTNCYNVNHQYQLVSNGSNRDRKIPNRIPVISFTNCDTSAYIKNNSVKVVSVMGAPINKSCAKDIARIINVDLGKVIIYGFDEDSVFVKNLETELININIVYCPGYKLPQFLEEPTFENFRAYLNITEMKQELENNIRSSKYEDAMNICRALRDSSQKTNITEVISQLINGNGKNIIIFAMYLWHSKEENIVKEHFPAVFALLANEDSIKFINQRYSLAIKVDANTDSYGDRLAWGDSNDKSSKRIKWKFVTSWTKGDQDLYFSIKNDEHNMYLKLEYNAQGNGDRKAWGDPNLRQELRFQWELEPIIYGDNVVFFIKNREYGQRLVLDEDLDGYNDRILLGRTGNTDRNIAEFAWSILPW